MRVHKTGPAADELKRAAFKLLGAVLGKLRNHPLLAGVDFFHQNSHGASGDLHTKLPGAKHRDVPVGRFDQRLAGHAAAQDAEAADLLAAFHHGHAQPELHGCGGGGITGASPAQDDEIEVFHDNTKQQQTNGLDGFPQPAIRSPFTSVAWK